MHCRIASCTPASPFAGRRSEKLRRSPLTEYVRAGNVTFLPPVVRSHIAKPSNRRPLNGPLPASKITSTSASFPLGEPLSLRTIFTDITSPLPLDMMDLRKNTADLDRQRWLGSRES